MFLKSSLLFVQAKIHTTIFKEPQIEMRRFCSLAIISTTGVPAITSQTQYKYLSTVVALCKTKQQSHDPHQ